MTQLRVTCQDCHQDFEVEVDPEGLAFIGKERLQKIALCAQCDSKRNSQRHKERFERKRRANEPF